MLSCRLSLLVLAGLFVCPAAAPAADPPLSDAAARKVLPPFITRDTRRLTEAFLALQKEGPAAVETIRGLGRLFSHPEKKYRDAARLILRNLGPAARHALPSLIAAV